MFITDTHLGMREPAQLWTAAGQPSHPPASPPAPDVGTQTFTGEVAAVYHHDPASGFFVATLRRSADEITVIGTAIFLAAGARISVSGRWVDDKRWGRQFRADSITLADQASALQVLLGSGFLKGVKSKTAQQIVSAFGDETFARLDQAIDAPDTLQAVKGIGPVNSRWIVQSWKGQRHWAQAALASVQAGLTMRQAREAYRRFGQGLPAMISDNPYLLTVVSGITWQRADEIARLVWPGKEQIDHDDPRRYGAAVREALDQAYREGHMALAEADALARARALARPSRAGFEAQVAARYAEDYLLLVEGWLYLLSNYEIERDTAEAIAAMLASPAPAIGDWAEIAARLPQYAGFELSPDQARAVQAALTQRVVVITGGPGTGKTTTTRAICNILADHQLVLRLCAPTGKAARRLSEATGREAATVHRTLGILDNAEARFGFEADAVLIDECSMLDAALMRTVVKACNPRTRLILIGDVDQLPPVGAGEPFYQIIQSGAPLVRLETIHRQGQDSGIVAAAHAVNGGVVPSLAGYGDIEIEVAASNAALPDLILRQVQRLVAGGLSIRDVQVLTPLNNYDWGQRALNLRLQAIYNPRPFPLKGCPFKPGDKVIHTRNVYDMRGQAVLNGMTGVVQWVASDEHEQRLLAERAQADDDEPPAILRVMFDGEGAPTSYTREELAYLKLAYAITCHKSQGSEFSHVVLAVPITRPDFMLRQLLYTGLTRASRYCALAATRSALPAYVQNEERVRRATLLGQMIRSRALA